MLRVAAGILGVNLVRLLESDVRNSLTMATLMLAVSEADPM